MILTSDPPQVRYTSDRGFQTDKESPNSEPTVQPRTAADEDIPTVSDTKDDRGRRRRTGVTRTLPVMKSRFCSTDRSRSHGSSGEYWENSGRPVTEAMTDMAGNYANISRDDYSDLVDQLVRETLRSWAESGEPQTKQYYGCRIPDWQCDGSIEIMEWGSVDMTETDDSEYEDPDDRANRLCVEESLNSGADSATGDGC